MRNRGGGLLWFRKNKPVDADNVYQGMGVDLKGTQKTPPPKPAPTIEVAPLAHDIPTAKVPANINPPRNIKPPTFVVPKRVTSPGNTEGLDKHSMHVPSIIPGLIPDDLTMINKRAADQSIQGNDGKFYSYNANGRLEEIHDANGNLTREFTYDKNFRLTEVNAYRYDEKGNKTLDLSYDLEYPSELASATAFEYDEAGNESRVIVYDYKGRVEHYTDYVRDENNNVVRENIRHPNGKLMDFRDYTYDAKGDKATCTSYNADGTMSHKVGYYPDAERAVDQSQVLYLHKGGDEIHEIYERDGSGRLLKFSEFEELSDGNTQFAGGSVYEYDEATDTIRVIEYNDQGQVYEVTDIVESDSGNTQSQITYNGDGTVSMFEKTTYLVDNEGYENAIDHFFYDSSGVVIEGFKSIYDEAGNETGHYNYDTDRNGNPVCEYVETDPDGNPTKIIEYDKDGNVVKIEVRNDSGRCDYDKDGNLVSYYKDGVRYNPDGQPINK